MNVYAMYFSATGTTETIVTAIAAALAERYGGRLNTFDFTLPAARARERAFSPDDLVVFGTPVYAGRVPNVLLRYLKSVRGRGALAVPTVVFGNRDFDDSLIELRDILQEDGFRVVAAAAFVGEHAFSQTLAAGRPDEKDLALARAFAEKVWDKLSWEAGEQTPVIVTGQTPVRPYYTPRDRQGNPISILKVKPKTDMDRCTRCGLCASLCPMGAIDPADPSQVPGTCIKCCACVKKCPAGAKYYDDAGYLYHKEELELGFARRSEPTLFL